MAGTGLEKTLELSVQALVREVAQIDDLTRERINYTIAKANETKDALAAVEPVGPNMKPRMLQVTSWIAHADVPNGNGFMFRHQDLQNAVANGLFQAPYFGMIDFNHDLQAYGAWYDAAFKYDDRVGQWGIIANGAVWAWRFREVADRILAMQARNGYVDVSVTALFKDFEVQRDSSNRQVLVLIEPVLVTTSLLDVDPADKAANGLVSEDPSETNAERTQRLLQASQDSRSSKEESSMDEAIAKIEKLLGDQKETLTPLVQAAAKLPQVEQELATATASLADLQSQIATLTEQKTAAETAQAEVEVALNAAKEELAAVKAENETLTAFKQGVEEAEAKAAAEKKQAERLAEVPAAITAKLNESPKKDDIIAGWMRQTDEEWEVTKASFEFVPPKRTYAERSAEEGALSSFADTSEGDWSINKFSTRKRRK